MSTPAVLAFLLPKEEGSNKESVHWLWIEPLRKHLIIVC